MSQEIEISGQKKPLEIQFEWKTAQILSNIEKAVDKIQAAVGDSWTATNKDDAVPTGTADFTDIKTSIAAAVATAVQDAILDIRAAMQVENKPFDTQAITDAIKEAIPPAPAVVAPEAEPSETNLETAVMQGIKKTSKNIKWNHDVLVTENPPSEALLDKAGANGYELITIIYDPANQKWVTYLKKLMII